MILGDAVLIGVFAGAGRSARRAARRRRQRESSPEAAQAAGAVLSEATVAWVSEHELAPAGAPMYYI